MRHWFRDRTFRSLLKNSGYLALSKGVAAVAGLITLALAGRGLGVALFGLLILVHSYAQAASGLTKFNSWQVVVRYGGPALREGDEERFRRATGFAFGLDFASGMVTMVGAIALLPLVAGAFGLPEHLVPAAMLYCLMLPTMGAGSASGVLRVFDRFDLLSWQGTVASNLRALFVAIAWWQDWGFLAYLVIWFGAELASDLVMWFFALRELRRRGLLEGTRPTLRADGLERAWPFAISINLHSSINTAWGPLGRLLVGALLSPAGAGLYRVASSIAEAVQRPSDFLNKAFYPEVMRLDPRTRQPWKLMARAMAVSSMVGFTAFLLVVFGGHWLLEFAFGEQFVGAYPVLLVLLGVSLLATVSFPMPAMLHAVGRVNIPLIANFSGAVVYLAAIYPMTQWAGLIGAGAAYLAGRFAMSAIMAFHLLRERRRALRPA